MESQTAVGGGVTEYNTFDNRESVDGVILAHNLTLEQLGVAKNMNDMINNSYINVEANFLSVFVA